MWNAVLKTRDDWTAAVLRVTLALVVLPHGAQKLFGWFGGYGFANTLDFFQSLGIPTAVGVLVILTETVGAIALMFGLGGRIVSALLGATMIGAIATVHWANGFFMNWSGAQAGEGFELHILALGIATALVITGSGKLSLDRALVRLRS